MTRVLAMNTDGQLTYCTAPEELRGKGRCNHIFHQNPGESQEDFLKRASEAKLETNPPTPDREELIERLVDEDEYEMLPFFDSGDIELAKKGLHLRKYVNHENECVRIEVAKQGYGLNKLINDDNYYVREEVANQGYGLDKLIYDPDYFVRAAVARQGYGLDKLARDRDWHVRKAVASKRTVFRYFS